MIPKTIRTSEKEVNVFHRLFSRDQFKVGPIINICTHTRTLFCVVFPVERHFIDSLAIVSTSLTMSFSALYPFYVYSRSFLNARTVNGVHRENSMTKDDETTGERKCQ